MNKLMSKLLLFSLTMIANQVIALGDLPSDDPATTLFRITRRLESLDLRQLNGILQDSADKIIIYKKAIIDLKLIGVDEQIKLITESLETALENINQVKTALAPAHHSINQFKVNRQKAQEAISDIRSKLNL